MDVGSWVWIFKLLLVHAFTVLRGKHCHCHAVQQTSDYFRPDGWWEVLEKSFSNGLVGESVRLMEPRFGSHERILIPC